MTAPHRAIQFLLLSGHDAETAGSAKVRAERKMHRSM